MPAVEDVLATRLDLLGLGTYVSGIGQATDALGIFDGKLSDVAKRQLSFGIAAGAVALGGFAFLGKAALAAGEDVQVFNRASANFKGGLPVEDIEELTGSLERVTGVADDSIAAFLGLLGTYQVTGDAAKELAEPILNAAEATGKGMDQIAEAVGKAMQTGSATGLTRSGIVIDDVGFKSLDAAGRLAVLKKALNDQGGATAARDAMNTLPGSIKGATTAIGSLVEAIGAPLVGPLQVAARVTGEVTNKITGLPTPVKTCITLIGVTLAGAMTYYSAQTFIAIGLTAKLAAEQLKAADAAGKMAKANSSAGTAAVNGAAKKGLSGGVKGALAIGAADLALQFLPDEFGGGAGRGLKNIGNGAALGAAAGSFIPGLGTAAGAAAGGTLGALGNLGVFNEIGKALGFGGDKKPDSDPVVEELQKQTRLMEQANRLPLSTSIMPGARQIGAMSLADALA